jgi:CubicO group peptidase (beta-lactamase class C family)
VLIQTARGKLGLDDPITDLLPQFSDMWVGELRDGRVVAKEPAKRVLTPRLLLSHQNGLHAGELGNLQGLGTKEDQQSLARLVEYLSTLKLDFQPAEAQMYSPTAAFDVCARLVELTSGMPYNEFVVKEICEPLGMQDTTFTPTDEQWSRFIVMHSRKEKDGVGISEDGTTVAGCIFESFPITWFSGGAGLCSTLPDYARFAEMLLNGGRLPDGGELIPEALIREMATPWVPYEIMPAWERWGLGVRVITDERHWLPVSSFGWSGAYGSHFWVDPVNRITAVYMKNSRYDGGAGSQTSIHFEQDVYACLE